MILLCPLCSSSHYQQILLRSRQSCLHSKQWCSAYLRRGRSSPEVHGSWYRFGTCNAHCARTMSVGKLDPKRTALFICDVQEVFREKSLIQGYDAVIDCARRLVRGAAAFEIPVFVTEQYPARLGSTVQEIKDVLPEACVPVPKTDFTMFVPQIQEQLRQYPEIQSVVLCSIEGHVCVLQTALDLLERKFDVHIVTDGVSSSKWHDRTVGIQRIAQCGGLLATAEMILFQLASSSKHPAFKQVSALVKESRPAPLPIVSML